MKTEEDKENVVGYIQKLHQTAQRCVQLQEQNYRFHIQHHNNIKKMMTALNRLADILSTRLDVRTLQVELEEDPSLLQSVNFTPKPAASAEKGRKAFAAESFHELVMSFANNPCSSELADHLVGTTQEQFAELQEESMDVILPTLANWLQSSDEAQQKIAMVYLWEAALKFQDLFHRAKNRKLISKFREGISNLDTTSIENKGVTEDELKTLSSFLAKCS